MNGVKQLVCFLATGVVTTLIDFALYNLLTGRRFGLGRIHANCLSTTAAMSFSFTVNGLLVFCPETGATLARALRFLMVTSFSAYVLQNLVIYLVSRIWLQPVQLAQWAAAQWSVSRTLPDEWVQKNTVKVMAVLVGMSWNFLWYKFFVYA